MLVRYIAMVLLVVLAGGCANSGPVEEEQSTPLEVRFRSPLPNSRTINGVTSVEVNGGASAYGDARFVDVMLVLGSSKSLAKTDPEDYRATAVANLVESLSPKSDLHIGVIGFSKKATLLSPLTRDRGTVVSTLGQLARKGGSDVSAGIQLALEEFKNNARPNSSLVIILFTDGKSKAGRAYQAMEEAEIQGVAIHTILLGSNKKATLLMQEIAEGTGGSFSQVSQARELPATFVNVPMTGVSRVTLIVNNDKPVPTNLAGGTFTKQILLEPGENQIVAIATDMNGQTTRSKITVSAGPRNCSALEVLAMREGKPTVSINERAVEIVVDASRSMWGRMDGQPKMVVAQEILQDVSSWLPAELNLALRAYGHKSPVEERNCADSQLLVAFGAENRKQIHDAIAVLRPLGQTPLAYTLKQVAGDFGGVKGERAVVLVTDGIESCGGDPVATARMLGEKKIVIHVIGFGMANIKDEDSESLDALARASGGRFLTASSAEELKEALAGTVGTPFQVFSGNMMVGDSAIGSGEPVLLPGGEYRVRLNSSPPLEVQLKLVAGEKMTMTFEKKNGTVFHSKQHRQVGYIPCTEPRSDQSAAL